jgi:uncharacterized cupin superfamily protein
VVEEEEVDQWYNCWREVVQEVVEVVGTYCGLTEIQIKVEVVERGGKTGPQRGAELVELAVQE